MATVPFLLFLDHATFQRSRLAKGNLAGDMWRSSQGSLLQGNTHVRDYMRYPTQSDVNKSATRGVRIHGCSLEEGLLERRT